MPNADIWRCGGPSAETVTVKRCIAIAVALTLAAAACSSGDDSAETTTSTSSTTTTVAPTTTAPPTTTSTTTTTTTTLPPAVGAPLNGLPEPDESLLDRRVIAVKVDNHPNARPQSALDEASAVYEIRVEGGLTRFVALFHETDSEYVGPIRSGRPTDADLTNFLGATFQISGASNWVLVYLRRQGIPFIGEQRPPTFRIPSRRAPHDLYGDTNDMRAFADERGFPDDPPDPIFRFGNVELEGESASTVQMNWSRDWAPVTWTWDEDTGTYLRAHGSTPHMLVDGDGNETQMAFDTLVVIKGDIYTARPPRPSDGVAVPATDVVGTGDALVFAQGKVVLGTWERETQEDGYTLRDEDGNVIVLPAGRPLIAIFPSSRSVQWS